jgi:hypothetical protein
MRWLLSLLLLAHVSAAGAADAQKPEVKSASVLGIPAGKTTRVVLYGEKLAPKSAKVKPPLAVTLIGSGPTDAKTKGLGSREVILDVTVPASCPHDTFELSLTEPDDSVTKSSLCVTDEAAVELPIRKPASTFAQAMPAPGPSVAITGQLDGDSADIVKFEGRAGETWEITLLGGRGGSLIDPVLRVRDGRRVPLALSAGDKKRDRHIEFRVPSVGVYYVEITEAEARGGASYTYRLSLVRKP